MSKASRSWLSQLVVAGAVAAYSALGCKSARIEQCNRLIERINGLDLTPPKGEDATAVEQLAKKAEQSAASLEFVSLKDERLIEFRRQYQDNLKAFGQVNRAVAATILQLAKSESTPDPSLKLNELEKELDAQRAEINQRAQESSKLTSDINRYCSGPS